jgi:non-specific protein-tyrosine kinase
MQLRRQLQMVRHWLWIIVGGTVIAAIVAYAVSSSLPKMYESEATLIVGQSLYSPQVNQQQLLASQNLARTYAQVATMRPTLEQAIAKLNLATTWDELQRRVTASASRDSALATIHVTDPDPDVAAAIANEIAAELIATSRNQLVDGSAAQVAIDGNLKEIQAQIELTGADIRLLVAKGDARSDIESARLDDLRARLVSLWSSYSAMVTFASDTSANGLRLIAPAVPADDPSSPRVLITVVLAALAGFVVAIAVAVFLEQLDVSVKDADEVERLTGWPTLSTFGRLPGPAPDRYRLVAITYPRSGAAEAFRTLRTNVEFVTIDAPPKTVLVTSSGPREGKSTIAANLAMVFAQAGKRTILVDGDLRKPSIHDLFAIQNSSGLTDLVRGTPGIEGRVLHPTEVEGLSVVPSGPLPPNPVDILGSDQMKVAIAWLSERADLVVFDSPPASVVADPLVLAAAVDATIFVVEPNRTSAETLRHMRAALDRVGAHVLGVSLNSRSGQASSADAYPYSAAGAPETQNSLTVEPGVLSGVALPKSTRKSRSGGTAP